jgi:superoxide reductase
MNLQIEKTKQDEGLEKHVPVLEKTDSGYKVKVGTTPHPMEKEHYIEWIELWMDDDFYERKFLEPGGSAEMEFYLDYDPERLEVREYCNVHGLWRN